MCCAVLVSQLVHGFINATGLSMLETDGPYGGGKCSSVSHAHHHGLQDSIYRQTQLQSAFYHDMRRLNVYVNQPDNYFFQGGSRTGMGYDEQQYSLPRWRDLSISRMGTRLGTFKKGGHTLGCGTAQSTAQSIACARRI